MRIVREEPIFFLSHDHSDARLAKLLDSRDGPQAARGWRTNRARTILFYITSRKGIELLLYVLRIKCIRCTTRLIRRSFPLRHHEIFENVSSILRGCLKITTSTSMLIISLI